MQIQSIRIRTAYGVSWGYILGETKAGKRKIVCYSTGQSFWI